MSTSELPIWAFERPQVYDRAIYGVVSFGCLHPVEKRARPQTLSSIYLITGDMSLAWAYSRPIFDNILDMIRSTRQFTHGGRGHLTASIPPSIDSLNACGSEPSALPSSVV